MIRPLAFSAALACAGLAAPVSAATLSDVFTSFYVLGDSNSDWGNLGANGPPPPYLNGQFSNGPVWADILDDPFQDPEAIRTWNYAFGGARVTETSEVPDLPTQLQVFAADLDPAVDDPLPGTPELGERPLVSIWFGANDIRAIYQSFLEAVDGLAPTDPAVDAAREAARGQAASVGALYASSLELAAADPRLGDLLTFTTADAAATPEYVDPDPLLAELVQAFNDQVLAALMRIEDTGVNVFTVDIFGLQQQVAADPAAFGFDNVTDACLTFDQDGPVVCDTPETYLFWDEVGHLSGAGHAALAGIVEETVLSGLTPVPLPASFPALMAALAAVGALRLRRS
ncbi:MAG: SGNH/GDSL hydrolase family protein [Pseudomonadota bacterium]